jgi:peptidoglycan-N-acetylglucosamine deacetylase
MTPHKPLASLSLDLDNQWSYMKIHGDAGWEAFPSYLDVLVPRVLDFLHELDLTITFFMVGQDAALEKNRAILRSIADAGHEIGNHSFNHDSWLHLYSDEKIEQEIAWTEEVIERVTGQRVRGFRGPGYSLSESVLYILTKRGYTYDCSTFPSILGPLARAYYFMTTRLTPEEKEKRKALFGGVKDGLQPLKPYRWLIGGNHLTEIPVSTMPIFRVPIHFSYLLYLGCFSPALAILYFRFALLLCRWRKIQPSLLLHPLDFLDRHDVPELGFFPAMKMPSHKKLSLLRKLIMLLSEQFQVVPMGLHAQSVRLHPHQRGVHSKFQMPIAKMV